MKATKPPRETLSSLNYRDAEETPTATAPDLKTFSLAALVLLGRAGVPSEGSENPGDRAWRLETTSGAGTRFDIQLSGPDIPPAIPDETAHPSVIPFQRPWVGVYRLRVRAPLAVFELAWRPDEPLRIMNFSRGNWEDELLGLAG